MEPAVSVLTMQENPSPLEKLPMTRLLLPIAASLSLVTSFATAQWSDNFDSYAASSQVVGQGLWEEWGPGAGAFVSNLQSRSPGNSIEITGPSDLVHQYSNITTGKWVYKTWQYIPSNMTGSSYFILLSNYAYPAGPYTWAVQVEFSVANGVRGNFGTNTINHNVMPVVTNSWVEIKVLIDLDNNWTQFYYNGVLLDEPSLADHPALGGGYSWTGGVFGGGIGPLNIAAVDLYANSASPVYYDDISLQPATYEVFGTGCSGLLGVPDFTLLSQAQVGGVYISQINNLPLSSAFHVLGFGNQTSLAGPLPLDLAAFGAPGCLLRVSPDSMIFMQGAQNSVVFAMPIPADPTLAGMKVYTQAAALDPTANALWLTTSAMTASWFQ
jgi:hypothetical protein